MNERIFELAKQSDLIQWDTLPSGARTPDHESVVKAQKFAALIVRECAGEVCKETFRSRRMRKFSEVLEEYLEERDNLRSHAQEEVQNNYSFLESLAEEWRNRYRMQGLAEEMDEIVKETDK